MRTAAKTPRSNCVMDSGKLARAGIRLQPMCTRPWPIRCAAGAGLRIGFPDEFARHHGGCGFIGSNFIRQRLLEDNSAIGRLVNLDKLTYAGNPANLADLAADPRYVFAHGDIGDESLAGRLLADHAIDAVVNFAADSHVDRSIDSPDPFVQTNVVGMRSIAQRRPPPLAGAGNRARERAPFASCMFQPTKCTEPSGRTTRPLPRPLRFQPNSPYAASKAASDHFVRACHHTYRLPTLTTNCSNNYGPYHFPEKMIPLMILNALDGKPLPVYGDGQQVRDWLYVEDHCRAISLVLGRGRVGETYNVGGLNERPNLEVVRQICSLLDRKARRSDGRPYADQISFVADRPGHDRRYAIDCSKLQKELGWAPRDSFETGLERTVDWYLGHREWCDNITKTRYARERLGAKG